MNQGRIQDFPLGGAPTLIGGGTNLRHRHFSVKTYVKTKEFGPVGERTGNFVCKSATVRTLQEIFVLHDLVLFYSFGNNRQLSIGYGYDKKGNAEVYTWSDVDYTGF